MQPFVTGLTAFALLLHAMVGCCWHHAHGCPACDALAVGSAAELACFEHHAGGRHDPCGTHEQLPQVPHEQGKCPGVCAYVGSIKTQADPAAVGSFDLIATAPVPVDAGDLWRLGKHLADVHPWHAPLRLHLLHQVLLI